MSDHEAPARFRWLDPSLAAEKSVLDRILRQASEEIEGFSADPKLTDPVVLLLLKAFSREFAEIYRQLEGVTEAAYRSLVKSLLALPRGPRPSETVLQFQASDPDVHVSELVTAVGSLPPVGPAQEEISVRFTPLRESRLGWALPAAAVLVTPGGEAVLLQTGGDWRSGGPGPRPPAWTVADPPRGAEIHLALDVLRDGRDDDAPAIFLDGEERAWRRCLWGTWELLGDGGRTVLRAEPGSATRHIPRDPAPELFSFRSDARPKLSLFSNRFVHLPIKADVKAGAAAVLAGAPPAVVGDPAGGFRRQWWKIRMPGDADPGEMRSLRILGNCLPAVNRRLETVVFGSAGAPAESLELRVAFEELLAVEEIRDLGSGRSYDRAPGRGDRAGRRTYSMREGPGGRVVIHLRDGELSRRPGDVQVTYATTLGERANGLQRGAVSSLYEPYAQLKGVVNVAASEGGEPARRPPDQEEELRSALRHHARCVVEQDYREMARLFDPRRIGSVEVRPGVTRTRRGLRRCVEVLIDVPDAAFVSDGEREHFRACLEAYLKSRSPVTEDVRVSFRPATGAP